MFSVFTPAAFDSSQAAAALVWFYTFKYFPYACKYTQQKGVNHVPFKVWQYAGSSYVKKNEDISHNCYCTYIRLMPPGQFGTCKVEWMQKTTHANSNKINLQHVCGDVLQTGSFEHERKNGNVFHFLKLSASLCECAIFCFYIFSGFCVFNIMKSGAALSRCDELRVLLPSDVSTMTFYMIYGRLTRRCCTFFTKAFV